MSASSKPERSLLARIFISSAEPRLRAGWRLIGQTAMMSFLISLFSCPVTILLSKNIPSERLYLISTPLSFFAITVSVFLARRVFDRRSLVSLGLSIRPQAGLDILAGVLIAGVVMGFIYLMEWSFGWLKFENFTWQVQPVSQVVIEALTWLLLFVMVGWQEELLARGYWLQNLAEGLNLFWGVLISSILFSLGHLLNPNMSWVAILGLVFAGLFLAYGYLRTHQLWLSIGLHIGWNFFEGTVFGFQVSGLSGIPRLIHHTVQGPELVTGGLFGPEAGLVVLPAMALGVFLIYGYTRNRITKRKETE
jgi:membrane protease YdiL (CAAX protease family)